MMRVTNTPAAAAKAGEGEGGSTQGSLGICDGVRVYQLTDKGLALEATVGASKYFKDGDLN